MTYTTMNNLRTIAKNNEIAFFKRNTPDYLFDGHEELYNSYKKTLIGRIRGLYPHLKIDEITKRLEGLEILPKYADLNKFGTKETFKFDGKSLNVIYLDDNPDKLYNIDDCLGLKLPKDIAVTDPYTNRFACMTKQQDGFYGTVKEGLIKPFYHSTDELSRYLRLALKPNGKFNLTEDETIFKGNKLALVKIDKEKTKLAKLKDEYDKLAIQMSQLKDSINSNADTVYAKVADKKLKFADTILYSEVSDFCNDYKNKAKIYKLLGYKVNGDGVIPLAKEKRWPNEDDFGGSLYHEYDGTLVTDYDIEQEYIETKYKNRLKLIEKQIDKLNNKFNRAQDVKFELKYGILIGDKTAYPYASVKLTKVTDNVSVKAFTKLKKLIKDI